MENTDRRSFVATMVAAGIGATATAAQAAPTAIPGFRESLLPSKDQMWSWIKKVNSEFGPQRLAGSKNQHAYIDWLESEFKALGCTTLRDHYTFRMWEADMVKDVAASLTVGGKTTKLDVLSYFPYSGTTLQSGPVSGRLIYLPVDVIGGSGAAAAALANAPPPDLANCIVAIESPCPLKESGVAPPIVYGTYPANIALDGLYKLPEKMLAAGLRDIHTALDKKCKGILLCWTDVSDDGARYQYMPFGGNLRETPTLWVGRDTRLLLKAAAASSGQVTMELRATVTPNATTDSLIAILPGSSPEIVTIGTHTDGNNINEENGAIGVLSLAKYAAALPARRRTLAFIMATGHMCGGPLSDKETCVGPNGQPGPGADGAGVFRDHPEIVEKTVASLAIEHLGAIDWREDEAGRTYTSTKAPTQDSWYVGCEAAGSKVPDAASAVMARATLAAAEGIPPDTIRMDVVKDGKASPESRPAIVRGIPSVGLIPLPGFLLEASPTGAIERLSPDVLHSQVKIFAKLMVTLEKLTTDEIHGKVPVDTALLHAKSPRSVSAKAGGEPGLLELAAASLLGLRSRRRDDA